MSLKRKRSSSSVKKSYDSLPWKKIDASGVHDEQGMMLDLEEVDGVEIVYEEVDGRKVPQFLVKEPTKTKKDRQPAPVPKIYDVPESMSAWSSFGLHPALLYTLSLKNYTTPTPIQQASLVKSVGASSIDMIGIAQTGSGKTLAYALPILHDILTNPSPERKVRALILVPTRELALQVKAHFDACVVNERGKVPVVSVGTLVGGMAMQKQERILQRGVDVLIGTPGRVWDIAQADNSLKDARWLVLDEADRLVQKGSFGEMEKILGMVSAENRLVFSASMDSNALKRKKMRHDEDPNMLSALLDKLPEFEPEVVNVSTDAAPAKGLSKLPATLSSYLLPALANQKDGLLYYFLLRYPARTLVFLPSIAHIRRLLPLLTTLLSSPATPAAHRVPVHALHSSLPQPTRLNALKHFRESESAILLATDVAARGLDVEGVACVVHYCPAETPASYLHRCGRTARSGRKGVSVTLCEPKEVRRAEGVWRVFGEPQRWEWDVDGKVVEVVKRRVELAREVEGSVHKTRKEGADSKWMREAAEALGVDYEEEEQEEKGDGRKLEGLKSRLKEMLKKPLVPKGVSVRYLTADLAQDMLDGNAREGMIGVRKV